MKTLANHTIIYDDECPMCDLYTGAFVSTGLLDNNGREAWTKRKACPADFDSRRARNEIALVDKATGEITYGIRSLFKILANAYPALNRLFNNRYFVKAMEVFYSFISYNRKVIAPPAQFEKTGSCTPDFSAKYRVAYIIFSWLVTSLILSSYSELLNGWIKSGDFYREFAICGGQVLFQGLIVGAIRPGKVLHYLGNMMTVSLMGALLLLPMLMIAPWVQFHSIVPLVYFMMVVAFMFYSHMNRSGRLGLPFGISASWVLYRVLILILFLL